jgi:hypothetical protein
MGAGTAEREGRADCPRTCALSDALQDQLLQNWPMQMDREPASSSAVISLGYDEPTQTLEVAFIGGSIYRYFKVGPGLWRQLVEADSKGRFLNAEIKPQCDCLKVR